MPKKVLTFRNGNRWEIHLYVVAGQYGPQSRGPTAHTFVLGTETKQWRGMPSLPVPWYVPLSNLDQKTCDYC